MLNLILKWMLKRRLKRKVKGLVCPVKGCHRERALGGWFCPVHRSPDPREGSYSRRF